jgi:hypothetical protein
MTGDYLQLELARIKIFLREPLGAIGSVVIPVVVYVGLGRTLRAGSCRSAAGGGPPFPCVRRAGLRRGA